MLPYGSPFLFFCHCFIFFRSLLLTLSCTWFVCSFISCFLPQLLKFCDIRDLCTSWYYCQRLQQCLAGKQQVLSRYRYFCWMASKAKWNISDRNMLGELATEVESLKWQPQIYWFNSQRLCLFKAIPHFTDISIKSLYLAYFLKRHYRDENK